MENCSNMCTYKMTDIYTDILNEHNINKSYNDNWSIYFPCTYDDTPGEIGKIKELNITDPNKKIFILQNSDS